MSAAPFSGSAAFYDEMVGQTAFEHIRANFDRLCDMHGISFVTCADVACGTGLFVQYLAGLAEKVYGVDISEEMLEEARRRNAANGAIFLRQGFTELELPEPVDLVTCNFDSLNYLLEEEELAEALHRFRQALGAGGHAVFDLNTIWQLEHMTGESTWVHDIPGGFSIWRTEWDPRRRIETLNMTNLVEAGDGLYRRSDEIHRERGYDLPLVQGLLQRAGFRWWRAYDGEAELGYPGPTTRRLVFVAGAG